MNAPVSRRALLGATAVVGAMPLPALAEAGSPASAADHPDAELFRLLDHHPALHAANKAAGDRVEALWDVLDGVEPERPDALRVRISDGFNVSQGQYRALDGPWVWFYEVAAADELRALSPAALDCDELRDGRWVTVPDHGRIARRAEVLAAHDAWWAECLAVRARIGVPAAEEAEEAAFAALRDIEAAIVATVPQSTAGVVRKAQFVLTAARKPDEADWHRRIVEDVAALAERGGALS